MKKQFEIKIVGAGMTGKSVAMEIVANALEKKGYVVYRNIGEHNLLVKWEK